MPKKYDGSSIEIIEDDRSRVRKRPTIYIPNTGKDGAIHIIFEVIDNAIDELTIKDSVGDTVTTIFDMNTKICTVIDDGRGIPQDKLLEVCTILNSSGKFDNDENSAYEYSGGLNGCGNKLQVFLSDWSEVTSMQNGKSLTYRFEDGLLKDTREEKSKEHGTIVKFKLSNRFVDIDSVIPDDIKERYSEKSYLFPDVKMQLVVTKNEKEVTSYSYGGKNIVDRVKKWKPDTDIIRVTDQRKVKILKNINDDDVTTEKVLVDIAFAFKEEALDHDQNDFIISYGNTIKTYTGGTHVDGLKEGVIKFFKNDLIPAMNKRDKELPITPSDMTAGLCAFIVAKVHEPEFRGQYKDQLSNQEVRFAVRDAVYDALKKEKPSVIKAIEEFVKNVTRGRMASKKVRKKNVSNAFSKDRLDKFKDIIYNLDTVEPELILVEGDSAADLATKTRDPHNQAIYPVKRPANIFDNTISQVNDSKTVFNDIMDICGIEPGKKCDPTKCRMKHILMMTDGDIDGDSIAISVICLLAKHCKPLIDAGIVGRILPPAYSFPVGKSNKRVFVRSQREFFDKIMVDFIKNVTIGYDGKDFTNKELYDFLDKNFQYDKKLEKLADRYCCDPKIMEYIARKYHGDYTNQKKSYWMEALKRFSGLNVIMENKTVILDGDIPGYEYMNLAFDEYFDRHVNRFKLYQSQNDQITGYTIDAEKDKSVYDVMHQFRKYLPKDVKRYKGLGELDDADIINLCMNRKSRTVVIYKFKNFENDMEKINIIMSTKKEFAEARSKILMNLRSDDLDIDT